MPRLSSTIASACLLFSGAVAVAQPVCGERYTISPGDTLSKLAIETIGDPRGWAQIYQYGSNSAQLGENPNTLEVGVTIDIPPCGQQVRTINSVLASIANNRRTPPAAITPATTSAGLRPTAVIPNRIPGKRPVEFLTGGDLKPLIDQGSPTGGMMSELVRAAFKASRIDHPSRIDFVNDRASHMMVLLRNDRYEFGFPWTKPDCSDVQSMPEQEKQRCEYVYSDPLYVVAIEVYGPRSSNNVPPRSFKDLENKRLCRPVDRALDDLQRAGLVHAHNVTIERPRRLADCFQMLEFGEVDYVTDMRFSSEIEIQKLKLSDYVTSYPDLVSAVELHLIAHRDDAQSSILWMREFNRGLAKIQASGEWDSIIKAGIMDFRRNLQRFP